MRRTKVVERNRETVFHFTQTEIRSSALATTGKAENGEFSSPAETTTAEREI